MTPAPERHGRIQGRDARTWLLAAAAVMTLGSDAAEPPEDAPPDTRPCLDRPMVVVYLHRLQDQVLDFWGIPVDSLADQEVVVRIRIAPDGSLRSHEILSSTSHRLAKTVDWALQWASPYGAVPDEAECLVRQQITLRFRNENPY